MISLFLPPTVYKILLRRLLIKTAHLIALLKFILAERRPAISRVDPNSTSVVGSGTDIHARQSHRLRVTAASIPTNCAAMNAATPVGAMPVKVSVSERATVTAGEVGNARNTIVERSD